MDNKGELICQLIRKPPLIRSSSLLSLSLASRPVHEGHRDVVVGPIGH